MKWLTRLSLAAVLIAPAIVERAKKLAAVKLEVAESDIVFADGLFTVTGKFWPMLFTGRFIEN